MLERLSAGRLSDHIGEGPFGVRYLFYGMVYLGFSLASAAWHVWAYSVFTGSIAG